MNELGVFSKFIFIKVGNFNVKVDYMQTILDNFNVKVDYMQTILYNFNVKVDYMQTILYNFQQHFLDPYFSFLTTKMIFIALHI